MRGPKTIFSLFLSPHPSPLPKGEGANGLNLMALMRMGCRCPGKLLMPFAFFRLLTFVIKFNFEVESIPSLLQTQQIIEVITHAIVIPVDSRIKHAETQQCLVEQGRMVFYLLLRPGIKANRGAMRRIHAWLPEFSTRQAAREEHCRWAVLVRIKTVADGTSSVLRVWHAGYRK